MRVLIRRLDVVSRPFKVREREGDASLNRTSLDQEQARQSRFVFSKTVRHVMLLS